MVELQGGSVSLNSEYGKGSEFIIELPVKVLPDKDCEQESSHYKNQESCIERINVEFSDIYL
jgi:hypothetical protein